MIKKLNLPKADLRLKRDGEIVKVFCLIRQQFLVCTPEEWVRQHVLNFLIHHKGFPKGRIASEYTVLYNGMQKRADIVIFDKHNQPLMIVECKAPKVKITEDTFFQLAQYQSKLHVPFLMMTNGLDHYNCIVSRFEKPIQFVPEVPEYNVLLTLSLT